MKILASSFDLEIFLDDEACDGFAIEPKQDFSVFGREGSGGRFVLLKPSGRVVYVSSEGRAGVIAATFVDFLRMIVLRPYWQDLLKFSGKGALKEMMRVQPLLEEALQDDQRDTDGLRERLANELRIDPKSEEPTLLLHDAVSRLGSSIEVKSPDGTDFESLFNRFTVEDNPHWRGR